MLGKKIYSISLVFIVLFYIVIGNLLIKDPIEYVDIEESILDLGCTWIYMNVRGFSRVDTEYLTLSQIEEKLVDGMDLLALHNYDVFKTDRDGGAQIEITGHSIDGQQLTITANNRLAGVANTGYMTYIVVDVIDRFPWNTWQDSVNQVDRYINSQGGSATISSTLVGYYDGRLGKVKRKAVCKGVLKKLEATDVKWIEEGEFISGTGYTSIIRDSWVTSKGPVNINVAARYNAFDDRTYIYIGTPIIAMEY